jgi:amino-acid N-acetyltransferase
MEYYDELPVELKARKTDQPRTLEKATPDTTPKVVIMKPRVPDVEELLDLINGFAADNLMLSRGPRYLYENLRDFVIAVDKNVKVKVDDSGKAFHLIVACGSLHVLWKDVAEIRSLAIHPDYQHLGLGSELVNHMKDEALKMGIKQLFTFTLTENFFKPLGFVRQGREKLPPKVWGECSRCPKYFKCDEVGMVLELGRKAE